MKIRILIAAAVILLGWGAGGLAHHHGSRAVASTDGIQLPSCGINDGGYCDI